MKRSDELKQLLTNKRAEMQAVLDAAKEGEKARALTSDEQTKFDNLKAEARALKTQIEDAEEMERDAANSGQGANGGANARSDTSDDDDTQHQRSGNGPHIKKPDAPYSVGKAIREYVLGDFSSVKLTGQEKEQHDELARNIESNGLLVPNTRDQNTTSGSATIDTTIHSGVSIIGKEPLYKSMGITILEGLHGSFKLGVKTPDTAATYAEKAAITQTANQPTFVTMAPERKGITDIFTKELLTQRNPAVQAAIVADMDKSVDRLLTADVYTVALAAATAVSTGAITVAGFNALMAAIDAPGAFAMARATFFEAKGVKVDTGSGKFLAELAGNNGVGRTHDGASAFYSTLFADGTDQQYLIYGAWEEIWMGKWGAKEILLNPYTYQKNGQVEMTVNALVKTVNRNSAAFVKSPDLDSAE